MAAQRRRSDRALRPRIRSPGRPPAARREHRERFWAAIARGDLGGASSELAAGGDWASQATSAAEALGAGESRARFEKSVAELARQCDGGDESAAKAAFVASSRALKELAEEAKVVDKLRLL